MDVSTGEFLTAQGNAEYIDKLLQNFNPSEVLISKQHKAQFSSQFGNGVLSVAAGDDEVLNHENKGKCIVGQESFYNI